jgi:hypothetical protein
MTTDGQFSPMHAEPVFVRGLMFVSDKASARRAGGRLKETTNKER